MQYASLTISGAPAAEPVLVADVKTHLRIDGTDEDALLGTYITAVRTAVERYLDRALITQTIQLRLDKFPKADGDIELPRSPVQSVTSVAYTDTDGDVQTIDSAEYSLDIYTSPARLSTAYGYSWPSTRDIHNAVTVTYVSGYGASGASVPAPIIAGIKMLLGTLYENREADLPAELKRNPSLHYLLDGYIVPHVV